MINTLPSDVSTVLDVGTGTGHYVAAALDARPELAPLDWMSRWPPADEPLGRIRAWPW